MLVFLIARHLYGAGVGLLAATFSALSAFSIQQAHFYTVDSVANFFTIATAYFAVRSGRAGRWPDFVLAGLTTGLSAACKVSGAYAALLVALAAAWRLLDRPATRTQRGLVALGGQLLLAGTASIIAFRIAQPYAFEGPAFFDVGLDPLWLGRLKQIGAEQRGELDFPSGRQWTGRAAILFPLVNLAVWGLGIPLGIASLAGWLFAGFELLKGKCEHLVIWTWATGLFLYLATRWGKTMRYFLPLYPILAIMAGYAVISLARRVARRAERPWARWSAYALTALVVLGTGTWGWAVFSIYLRPHTRVAASRWVYENVEEGATLANEHWDWGIPLRIDGHDPFSTMYHGLEMAHYDEDTPEKLDRLVEWLDQADYAITASNRLYASIPRIPARYPLTTAYYQALFAGELGFELAADFSSYPAIGPIQFPDDENPFHLMEPEYSSRAGALNMRLPAAEEAFSVYDHPRVLIFRKTDEYDSGRAAAILERVDLAQAVPGLSPQAAARAPTALAYDRETWSQQQAGGTWSQMYDRADTLNVHPGVAAAAWWAVVTLLGWFAFPLLFVATPRLKDRGYGLAKVVGLLVLAYLTWLGASLRLMPNTRDTIARIALLLVLTGAGVGFARRKRIRAFVAQNWRVLVLMEGVFAALYVAWIGVRLLNPDLWHNIVGGEKPMDFAYLNAVMKSTWFPPYNPWLSGHRINYYYFGFVFVGTLIKLVGTVPSIAYNLAVPLLYAMTGLGTLSIAYNLHPGGKRRAVIAGLAALLIMVVLGNLGVVRLIRQLLIGVGGEPIVSTIPGLSEAVGVIRGLWAVVVEGVRVSVRPETWYWYPTRIIPVEPGDVVPITEFPAFTFLYGDLHAHMIALPIALATLGLALNWARTPRAGLGSIALGGLIIGALRPTNTWDYPTYLVLGAAGLILGLYRYRRSLLPTPADLKAVGIRLAALIGFSNLFFLPYLQSNAGGQSARMWEGSRTPLEIYLWIYGIALFPLLTHLVVEAWRAVTRAGRRSMRPWIALGAVLTVGLALALAALGYQVALLAVPLFAASCVMVITRGRPTNRRLLWLIAGSAAVLSLAVEVIVLEGDIGRMNTVFKVYLQVWTLFALAAGVALAQVLGDSSTWPSLLRNVWMAAMASLVVGGGLFLAYGIRARAVDRMMERLPATLDGAAFMAGSRISDGNPEYAPQEINLAGDAAAIRWLQENVQGSPVILEGLGHREYLWANRVSIYTGLPTVVGWRWHQVQQRPSFPSLTVDRRRADVNTCYETGQAAVAWPILERYGVTYIYVGDYERAYYGVEGLAKFDEMTGAGNLRVVYDSAGVRIYQVIGRVDQT